MLSGEVVGREEQPGKISSTSSPETTPGQRRPRAVWVIRHLLVLVSFDPCATRRPDVHVSLPRFSHTGHQNQEKRQQACPTSWLDTPVAALPPAHSVSRRRVASLSIPLSDSELSRP